jgi:hypothetical protein
MIERRFDVPLIADLALREKQIQQNYRPYIAVHKWFARRPGTLFRGLILSEFVDKPLSESFYECHDLRKIRVADPFMGGGSPLLEANRLGCDILGYDINPMAYWIVQREIEHLDLEAYRRAADTLRRALHQEIGTLYTTHCALCGRDDAPVKYFLWVKTIECSKCHAPIKLFPGYLIAQAVRHPKNVLVCSACGALEETDNPRNPGNCGACRHPITLLGPASRNKCLCPECGGPNTFPQPQHGPPRHALFAIEYHCPACRGRHAGRFFKKPDAEDLKKYKKAEQKWAATTPRFIPDDEIPPGDESDRLHRWGYRRYGEMFNARQLLGLEASCRLIDRERSDRIHHALATNLSDLLRYQNMLCRYDSMALKSLDVFSVHGFPVGLIQCESNLLGILHEKTGVNVGSGGWTNIVEKYVKAKEYCEHPFEYRHQGGKKMLIKMPGERIGDFPNGGKWASARKVQLFCADASVADLPPASLDAVLTDPPYFGNVQYAELMDFCYVWLRKLMKDRKEGTVFRPISTRNTEELTGNASMGRDLAHFTEGLSSVLKRLAKALKPGSPLAFTYHHNDLTAYAPVAVALLDSGLVCSGSIPCPAEMGASIHINGTGSSIIDTIFVCRSTGTVPRKWITSEPVEVARLIQEDVEKLKAAVIKPTVGDIRCISYGHMIRLAVWFLRKSWRSDRPTVERISRVTDWLEKKLGGRDGVLAALEGTLKQAPRSQRWEVQEGTENYGQDEAQVSF